MVIDPFSYLLTDSQDQMLAQVHIAVFAKERELVAYYFHFIMILERSLGSLPVVMEQRCCSLQQGQAQFDAYHQTEEHP